MLTLSKLLTYAFLTLFLGNPKEENPSGLFGVAWISLPCAGKPYAET